MRTEHKLFHVLGIHLDLGRRFVHSRGVLSPDRSKAVILVQFVLYFKLE